MANITPGQILESSCGEGQHSCRTYAAVTWYTELQHVCPDQPKALQGVHCEYLAD